MTERHLAIIIEPADFQYDTHEDLSNVYDLYALHHEGKDLPDGVWIEEWLVPDGMNPLHSFYAGGHDNCNHQYDVLDWNELESCEMGHASMKWTKEEWAHYANELKMIAETIKPLLRRGMDLAQVVRERIDENDDLFDKEMDTSWGDYEFYKFYAGLASDAVERGEE
jgi:hypothetical protein